MRKINDNAFANNIVFNIYFIILSIFVFFGYIIMPRYSIQAIILVVISFIILSLFRIKKIKYSKNMKWFILYLLMCIISIMYTIDLNNSIIYLLVMLGLFIYQLCLNSIDAINDEIPINIISFFSFLHVMATIIQLINPTIIQNFNKIILPESGFLYNTSLQRFGCYAGICSDHGANAIFISIFLIIISVKLMKNKSAKNFILFSLGIIALFLTGKRGYLIGFVFAFLVALIYDNKENRKTVIKNIIFILIIITLVFLILKLIPSTSIVIDRFLDLSNEGNMLNGREDMYNLLVNNIKRNWMIGSGANSTMAINLGNHGHNAYLQIFSELGILGFSFFITMIISNLIRTLKNGSNINSLYSISYQVFFISIAFTGNPMHYIPTLVFYFLMVSKIYIKGEKNENRNSDLS